MGDRVKDALGSPKVWGVLALVGLGLFAAAGDRKR
jgi:hypothetical protein